MPGNKDEGSSTSSRFRGVALGVNRASPPKTSHTPNVSISSAFVDRTRPSPSSDRGNLPSQAKDTAAQSPKQENTSTRTMIIERKPVPPRTETKSEQDTSDAQSSAQTRRSESHPREEIEERSENSSEQQTHVRSASGDSGGNRDESWVSQGRWGVGHDLPQVPR